MDNDGIKGWTGQEEKALGKWQAAGLDSISWQHQVSNKSSAKGIRLVQRSRGLTTAGTVTVTTTFDFRDDHLDIEHVFQIPKAINDLPRIEGQPDYATAIKAIREGGSPF